MSGIYIGVNEVAKKVKKMYVGVNGVAKKVKKAYIGVNGKAKLFFISGKELKKVSISSLSSARRNIAVTSTNNYVFFGGGNTSSYRYAEESTNTVEAYNTSLVRSLPSALAVNKSGLSSSNINGYALFAGGQRRNSGSNYGSYATVETYNSSLTRGSATNLSAARYVLASSIVGDYILFAGGYTGSSESAVVDTYNSSLTRTTITSLSESCSTISSAYIDNYAIFGFDEQSGNVNAYNSSLTRSIAPTRLSSTIDFGRTAVSVDGKNVLFAGGKKSAMVYATVERYNSSLTKGTATNLSVARANSGSTSIGSLAIIAGGDKYDSGSSSSLKYTFYSQVDAYDASLTKISCPSLSQARGNSRGDQINGYGLIGGGANTVSGTTKVVDAYIYQ